MLSKQFKSLSLFTRASLFNSRSASTFTEADPSFKVSNFTLPKANQELLIERPWSIRPFTNEAPLQLPIFDFQTGSFTGRLCNLDEEIYNNYLRRDIVHNVYRYFQFEHKRTFRTCKTRGDVAGSGIKMRPQKKSGRARQGDKRAPHLYKGGKSHGPVPKDYYFPVNEKVRLQALKAILSARLYEERIILIDSEKLDYGKTKYLSEIVAPYKQDKLLFLAPFEADENFSRAAQNIQNLSVFNAHTFNVLPIVNNDWIIAPVKALQELEMIIENREANLFRNKKVPRERLPYDDILIGSLR